eukprot:GEMP01032063.1.p1 GENE.GEMP01032063.1~~GEMP01032063.1.p1  ORF type:complete len:451 (+),score=84.67 GEMP01032063.1:3-1355(+)
MDDDRREQVVRVLASFPAAALGAAIRWNAFRRRFYDQYQVRLTKEDLASLQHDFIYIENDSDHQNATTIRWIESEEARVKRGLQPLLGERSALAPSRQVTLKDWKGLYRALVRVISRKGQKLEDAPVDYPHAVFFCKLKPFLREEMKAYDFDEHLWGFKKMRHLLDALIRWADSERIYTLLLHKSGKRNDYMLCCAGPEDTDDEKEAAPLPITSSAEADPPDVRENMELRILVAELQKRLKIQVPEEMKQRDVEIRRLRIENAELKKRVACVYPSFAYGHRILPTQGQAQSSQSVNMTGPFGIPLSGPQTDGNGAQQWPTSPHGFFVLPPQFYNPMLSGQGASSVMSQNPGVVSPLMSPMEMMSSGVYPNSAMCPQTGAMSTSGMSTASMLTSSVLSSFSSDYASTIHSPSLHSYHPLMMDSRPFCTMHDDRAMIPQGIVEAKKASFDFP